MEILEYFILVLIVFERQGYGGLLLVFNVIVNIDKELGLGLNFGYCGIFYYVVEMFGRFFGIQVGVSVFEGQRFFF